MRYVCILRALLVQDGKVPDKQVRFRADILTRNTREINVNYKPVRESTVGVVGAITMPVHEGDKNEISFEQMWRIRKKENIKIVETRLWTYDDSDKIRPLVKKI